MKTPETLPIVLISSSLLFISFLPFIYQAVSTPPGRVFAGVHNYVSDFYGYLAQMKQGAEGSWLTQQKYTTEPHPGSLMGIFYLLLGKVGSLFRLSMPLTYNLSRLFLGAGWLLAIYLFICRFFSDSRKRLLAFLLAALSTSFPKINCPTAQLTNCKLSTYMNWWTEMDAFRRATFLPHYLLGHILTVSCLLLLLKAFDHKEAKYALGAGILGAIAGLVHPPSLIIIYAILTFWGVVKFIQHHPLKSFVIRYSLFVILSVPSLLYINWLTSQFPWSTNREYAAVMIVFKDYILGLGPLFFLGALGITLLLQKKKLSTDNCQLTTVVGWFLSTFFLAFVLPPLVEQSNVRFIQVALPVPLAILSAYALSNLKSKRFLLFAFCFLLFISLPSYYVSLRDQLNEFSTFPTNVYPTEKEWEAFQWLDKNTDPRDIVFSAFFAGNMIPALSGNTVFLGHASGTVDFGEKKKLVERFFGGQLGEKQALDLLRKHGIDYIFYGKEEKALGEIPFAFLSPVFENNEVTIYKNFAD